MKILHVVGARPNFMKAAPAIAALKERGFAQVLVHTGQHYDAAMSDIFFRQLGMPEPDLNLNVGSASHAAQTAAMLVGIEQAVNSNREREDKTMASTEDERTFATDVFPELAFWPGPRTLNQPRPFAASGTFHMGHWKESAEPAVLPVEDRRADFS